MKSTSGIGIIILLFLCVAPVTLQSQVITTQYGKVQGIINDGVYQFLGIPFAKPPVGSLRWNAPENPAVWTDTLKAENFSPVCPQKNFEQGGTSSTIIGSEDCLYLNIWTPQVVTANLPVMVYIHGGGNQQGSASEENGGTQMFFGKNLSKRGNVVVVTIQYRLGPLGFLTHPGIDAINGKKSGNYAVLDQLLALHWVKNNIGSFGGNPSNITIFGESAGGINVGNLLLTPSAAGLFQRAIIQSAVPYVEDYQTSIRDGKDYVNQFVSAGSDADKINYMKTVVADSLVKFETSPVSGGTVGLAWSPTIDSILFFDFPVNSFKSGSFNKVPLLLGSNADEMSISAPATVYPIMVTALINNTVPAELRNEALLYYPPGANTAEARISYIGILTDLQFTSTARRTAQCVSLNQTEPVYRYFFTYRHTVPTLTEMGSYHGMELFYVFNNWENATLGKGILFKPSDDSVQQVMLKYWTNFAQNGSPNGTNLVNWPQYNAQYDNYIDLKATPDGSKFGVRTSQCDLWEAVTNAPNCNVNTRDLLVTKIVFEITPNPAYDYISFKGISEHNPGSVQIFSLSGQCLLNAPFAPLVNISALKTGFYLVRINSKKGYYTSKFIKL